MYKPVTVHLEQLDLVDQWVPRLLLSAAREKDWTSHSFGTTLVSTSNYLVIIVLQLIKMRKDCSIETNTVLVCIPVPLLNCLRFSCMSTVISPTCIPYCLQQQQPFYGPLSRTTRVSWYQKKHSPTHHPDHHPVFISFFHLLRSIASSLFK